MPASPPLLTRSTQRRRARLSDLERDIDPGVWDERRTAVRTLLARPLLTGSDPTRQLVARHQEWLGLWFAHHVGWELAVDPDACRLTKRPSHFRDATRPCRDPVTKDTALTRRGYVFLCLVLGELLRAEKQLTLQDLATQLESIAAADPTFAENGTPLALDRRETRRDLVAALRVLLDWGALRRIDGSEEGYVAADTGDVLYTISRPVLSRLLAARRPPSLVTVEDPDERMAEMGRGAVAEESDDWRIREIGFSLFRRLLDDPVLYYEDLDEAEREYLDKQRPRILREIERATGLVPEVRAEGIAMVDRAGELSDYHLPETGTDGHLALLLATWLADRLRNGDTAPVPILEVEAETRRLAGVHKRWRKDARKEGAETVLTRDTLARLEALGLVVIEGVSVRPRPAIGRFGLREENSDAEGQEDLFSN